MHKGIDISITVAKMNESKRKQGNSMNYRNPKILKGAQGAPCMVCGNTVTTVACHSNKARHGKGTGLKAHDIFVAYLCAHHHNEVDGRTGKLTGYEADAMWQSAHDKTIIYLLAQGIIK